MRMFTNAARVGIFAAGLAVVCGAGASHVCAQDRAVIARHAQHAEAIPARLYLPIEIASSRFALLAMTGYVAGVSHQITVSMRFDPASVYARDGFGDTARATLTAIIRVSDHARESHFFGPVPATFADFAVADGAPERTIWQDTVCHQDRGLPRIAVVDLRGFVSRDQDQDQAEVSARPRHIGLHLPPDEIVPHQALVRGSDQLGQFMAEQVETSRSRIHVIVKLYTQACNLASPAKG
jgi:hypothetical protein